MDGISAGNLLFGLNHAKSIEHKLNRFISKKDTNGDNALGIKELGVRKDVFDRIDKNGDGQADKFELIMAAHKRAHAVNEKTNQVSNKKDTSGDGVWSTGELGDVQVGRGELNIAARNRIHAVNKRINHLISKKDSNGNGVLDAGELGMSKEVFDKIDKDGNGQVGKFELNAAAHARAAINNLLGDILPDREPSKLDATV